LYLLSVSIASKKEEIESVFKLRYQVYISEQGKPYPDADHKLQRLLDPLDDVSTLLVARHSDAIVGSVRSSWFDIPQVRRSFPMFSIGQGFPVPLHNIGIATRLVIDFNQRGRAATNALLRYLYRLSLERGDVISFAACNLKLASFFQRYGFIEFAPPYQDPVVGPLARLVLFTRDLHHLEAVRSPFLPVAQHGDLECPEDRRDEMLDRLRSANP
jgi:predicted GNAT family N-acyltransferase